MRSRTKIAASATAAALVGGALLAAPPADAAQSTTSFMCGGQELVVRTNDNNSSDNGGWGVGVTTDGSGHLIPTAFSFSAYDITADSPLFSGTTTKGGGSANHSQDTVTCTSTIYDTLGDFAGPGNPLPRGTSPDDQISFTIAVTAVPKLKS